jgi:hypothetical protein
VVSRVGVGRKRGVRSLFLSFFHGESRRTTKRHGDLPCDSPNTPRDCNQIRVRVPGGLLVNIRAFRPKTTRSASPDNATFFFSVALRGPPIFSVLKNPWPVTRAGEKRQDTGQSNNDRAPDTGWSTTASHPNKEPTIHAFFDGGPGSAPNRQLWQNRAACVVPIQHRFRASAEGRSAQTKSQSGVRQPKRKENARSSASLKMRGLRTWFRELGVG